MSKELPYRIAVLDGLRGIACLIVFNEHLIGNLTANPAWGCGAEGIRVWTQLPFVRLWFTGNSALTVLFVTSGYVQSRKPFALAPRRRDLDAAIRGLSSTAVRRFIRLYLPTFAVLLVCTCASYAGLFEIARANYGEANEPYWLHEKPPPRLDSLTAQAHHLLHECCAIMKFTKWPSNDPVTRGSYNDHTWTIPLEYCTSVLLFLVLTCLCWVTIRGVMMAVFILIGIAILYDRWEVACFLAGSVIALRTTSTELEEERDEVRGEIKKHRAASKNSWVPSLVLILGMFLLSTPIHECSVDPFYGWLTSLMPSATYDEGAHIRSLGAACLVWSILHHRGAQKLLTNERLLYLGKVSFSFYLVHGPVIRCIYHSAIPYIYSLTGDGTYDGQDARGTFVAWLLGIFLCLPSAQLLAVLFYRYVEVPSLQLSRWLGRVLCMKRKEKGP